MNTPGLRDPVVMRVLSDFIGRLLRALVCLRQTAHSVMLTTACFVDMNTGRHWVLIVDQSDQGNIPEAVTWACAVRMKARFVLLIFCKLSPGVVTL